MRCDMCNGAVSSVIGSISFASKVLGRILVPHVKHSKCRDCGDISIDFNESKKIHDFISKKESDAIYSLPIGDFISLNEAADILGITKQAFSKHSRIKRGFIYSVTIDNKKLFYKKSVEEFKRTGKDGRIMLAPQKQEFYEKKKAHTNYIDAIIPYDKSLYGKLEIYGMKPHMELFTKCSGQARTKRIFCATTH
ncbi:helix-turn-helix domain-containing protein [Geobacter benzoatilyticus]|jgi:predicted DNA-binding protein YlxM (UPF0122 family)|uniref:Helix-turn-helix domain-containing protein n=1 Tax=Geobacter benzoatilyticus TaxID=2815309 RepID=A0ABX7Q5C0_9BACT|nr:helix-turn-helix domain-containing protein [Geobacter benzoatilyticus]QSV46240.1 helix-turn-helix domain-containing protein [Geobacter benzoatilyticus]